MLQVRNVRVSNCKVDDPPRQRKKLWWTKKWRDSTKFIWLGDFMDCTFRKMCKRTYEIYVGYVFYRVTVDRTTCTRYWSALCWVESVPGTSYVADNLLQFWNISCMISATLTYCTVPSTWNSNIKKSATISVKTAYLTRCRYLVLPLTTRYLYR